MNTKSLKDTDPRVYSLIQSELERQSSTLEMIASENFVSPAVMDAMGSVLTNKYAEGYPGKRYYGGCEFVDQVEDLARERAMKLFGASYANVQPHSGSQANMAVYFAALKPMDTILAMDLSHGGHLTHGSPVNFSGKFYRVVSYGVQKENGRMDMNQVEALAKREKPKLIVCGASAYPRWIPFEEFRQIADAVNAKLMADIAHPAGLIAAGEHPSPFPHCDFVTTTTHKTLRGPRGGMILSQEDQMKALNSNIFPGIQGGPMMHVIAAKAVAFEEALQPNFKDYARKIISNAQALARRLMERGFSLVSGGTDNHMMLVDLRSFKVTGKLAESSLDRAGITVNKNMVPFDDQSPFVTSGIRIGTPALTTRGMGEDEMFQIGDWIFEVIQNPENEDVIQKVRKEVLELTRRFPMYEGLKVS